MASNSARPADREFDSQSQINEASDEDKLRQELENVRRVNESIEGLIASLKQTRSNVKAVNTTVGAASSLLDTWTRILSQTEHTQNLILNPDWQGMSQDAADMEQEEEERQNAVARRAAEEEERKANTARRLEEDRLRSESSVSRASSKYGVRGRVRAPTRGSSTSATPGANTSSTNSSYLRGSSSSTRRTTSGSGRARGIARGRG